MFLNFYTVVEVVHNHDTGSTLIPVLVFTGTSWEKYIAEETLDDEPLGTTYNDFLKYGCRNGLLSLSEWCVEKGADNFNWALKGSCQGNHQDLAEWAVEKGANYFDEALWCACRGGHHELAKWCVEKGAYCFDCALEGSW